MKSDPSQKQKKQLGFVAVLLLVFLVALLMSPSSGDGSGSGQNSASVSLVSLKTQSERLTNPGSEDPMEGFASTCVLPRMSKEKLKSCDLFQPPYVAPSSIQPPSIEPSSIEPPSIEPSSIEPAPEPTAEQTESEPTIEFKVGAVYGAYNRPDQSALIDGKIVQTGEELESGVTVVSVSPEGVQVAP